MNHSTRYTSPQLRALYVLAAIFVALCHLAYDLGVRASVHRPVLVSFVTRYARIAASFSIGFVRGLITPEAADSDPVPPRDAHDLEPVAPAIDFDPSAFLSDDDLVDAFFASIPDEPITTPDVPFTLKALRAECIRFGLPTYGTKAQLLARLEAPF